MSSRKMAEVCGECGVEREMHGHDFRSVMVPVTCVCDPSGWTDPFDLPEVCGAFVDDPADAGHCATCHHDPECHPPQGG